MGARAEAELPFQRASRDRVVVPVEALRSHHSAGRLSAGTHRAPVRLVFVLLKDEEQAMTAIRRHRLVLP